MSILRCRKSVDDSSAPQSGWAGMDGIRFVGRDHQQSGVWGSLLLKILRNSISRASLCCIVWHRHCSHRERGVKRPPTPSLAELVDPGVMFKVCDSSVSERASSVQSGGTQELGRVQGCVREPKNRAGSWFLEKTACMSVQADLGLLDWCEQEKSNVNKLQDSLLGITPSPGPASQNLLPLAMLCNALVVSTYVLSQQRRQNVTELGTRPGEGCCCWFFCRWTAV